MFRWGLLLAASGCAQLAGIDNTSKGTDAAPPPIASLTLERVSVGRVVSKSPQDLLALNASFLVPDASAPGGLQKVAAMQSAPGVWSADIGGVIAPVMYESPDLPTLSLRILDFPTATPKAVVTVLERSQAPEAMPMNATISVNLNLPTPQAGQGYQMQSLGAWTVLGIPQPADTSTVVALGATALTTANSPTRRLDRILMDDTVVVLRYAGNQVTGHYITHFDQAATQAITGNMVATPLDQMLDIRVNQQQCIQRLSTVRPAMTATTSFAWRAHAAPGRDYSVGNGVQLHALGIPVPTTADPQTLTGMYGNPFTDIPVMLIWDVRTSRVYTSPGGTMYTLSAGMTHRALPGTAVVMDTPAGLPDRITAGTTLLTIDNAVVTAPTDAPVTISFVTDRPDNSMYWVELFELVPMMAQQRVVLHMGIKPEAKIPREFFKPGSQYVARAFSFSGCYPNAAMGDLTVQTQPCAFSFADSGVFQVVAP